LHRGTGRAAWPSRLTGAGASCGSLGAGAIVGDMSEIPLGDESGEVAAANVDDKTKLDDEAEAEAEAEAQLDAEAEAEAEVEPEAEGEL
jgi:hypothetical protein